MHDMYVLQQYTKCMYLALCVGDPPNHVYDVICYDTDSYECIIVDMDHAVPLRAI